MLGMLRLSRGGLQAGKIRDSSIPGEGCIWAGLDMQTCRGRACQVVEIAQQVNGGIKEQAHILGS